VLGARIGVVQPVIVEPGAESTVTSLGVEFDRHGAGIDVGRGGPVPPAGPPWPIAVFTGGAFLASTAFLKATGGFDERWFLYYEDADLACRGTELGWEYRLVPGAVVEHAGGVSTSGDPDRTRYLQERNRLLFAARHLPAGVLARALWLSVRRLRHAPRRVHRRALAAGLAGIPSRSLERVLARRRVSAGVGD
jgi:GT2 family glycosyltransferase